MTHFKLQPSNTWTLLGQLPSLSPQSGAPGSIGHQHMTSKVEELPLVLLPLRPPNPCSSRTPPSPSPAPSSGQLWPTQDVSCPSLRDAMPRSPAHSLCFMKGMSTEFSKGARPGSGVTACTEGSILKSVLPELFQCFAREFKPHPIHCGS